MSLETKGSLELEREVLQRNICTLCGACMGMCPYLVAFKGRAVLLHDCDLSQGRCYTFCPRTSVDLDLVSQATFGVSYGIEALGTVSEVIMARSSDAQVRSKAQYGGVVSSLISFALKEGYIDSAVLTLTKDNHLPGGVLVRNEREVLRCSGSNYVASPTLEVFNQASKTEVQKIGVVGTPCQALALGKMKASTLEDRNNIDKLKLVIGLFCTWALDYKDFMKFLQREVTTTEAVKFDIPPPPANVFEVHTSSDHISFPLDQIRGFIRKSCHYCLDMTAEFADISVGAVEGTEGWNTVIIRNEKGKELVERAAAKGAIEIDQLPMDKLEHLKEASLMKKKKALRAIVERTGDRNNLLYLKMGEDKIGGLLS
ncbi:MAG: Coenzyme F420 hydrogenase/dehydrogenase, beta subunit C-terminal domain [Syntrophales bacterium]